MAKVKDTTFLGEKLEVGNLVVVATKSGKNDFCWAIVTRFMGSTIMIQEVENPATVRRVNDVLLVHAPDVETTLGAELFAKYTELQKELNG